jgi:hypothetical protein
MRTCLALLIASTFSLGALAAEPSCSAAAGEKKLAGAAKTSFMKKCEAEAQARCEQSAADKKLAGAAKSGHVKKCMTEAVGS